MMLIGVDPHKSTHTATAVEPGTTSKVASIRIEATLGEYRRMLNWAARWPQRRCAIENAEGLGRHLASWLLARGEEVVDVPSTATARVRQLSRGGGRKNDRIDAAAAACVAAAQGDYRAMVAEGAADALAVLDEHRVNLAQARVRAVNQLHALLRALLAGGAPTDLTAATASALLGSIRPKGEAERARKAVARDLIAEIRSLDARLKSSCKAIAEQVENSGSSLREIAGIGPIIAAHHRPDRSAQPVPELGLLRQPRRCRTDRGRQRRPHPPPPFPDRGPATELGLAHRGGHPDPHDRQPRPPLLPDQDR